MAKPSPIAFPLARMIQIAADSSSHYSPPATRKSTAGMIVSSGHPASRWMKTAFWSDVIVM
nr:hypothetical protein [Mesorhizobium sp.]